ncbi:MAG: trypsin-like peptidase domain-containing protein [Acidobacteriota bacterium]
MSRLMFVFLSGTEKGKTRIFTQSTVSIGTSDSYDLTLVAEEGGLLPEGLIAEITNEPNDILKLIPRYKTDFFPITINGEPVSPEMNGIELQDGDTIHFGHGLSSASILFQVMPENFSTASLVHQGRRALDPTPSPQPVHPLTATLFVKELSASLWAEVPRKIKLIGLGSVGILTLILLFIIFFNFLILHRNTTQIESLRKQAEKSETTRLQDQEIIKEQQDEIKRLRDITEQSRQFTQRIAEQFSQSVCLIVGSYTFVEKGTGKVLKYETVDNSSGAPIDKNGNLLASVDGAGEPVRIDYTGTGFVIKQGMIATNRHIVKPWASDSVAQLILSQSSNLRPQLDKLAAFFPSIKKEFDLKEAISSDKYDISLCSFEQDETALPEIPMSTDDPRSIIGESVVVLGYPTGVDGLLQRIDDEGMRREILRQHGASAEDVAVGLASRGLIRPLTTTGNVTDALPNRLVHSAQTTEGGSGSPIFDREGRVIAINSAILTPTDGGQSFGGSNFGVPIKATYDLLLAFQKQ